MANAPFLTLFVALWARIRWVLTTVLLGIAAGYAGVWIADRQGMRPNAGEVSEDFMVALLMIALPSIIGAAAVLLAHSDAENLSLAVPARIHRMPLATWKIALALLVFGMGVAALLALAGTLPALWLLNVDFAWWLPVLTAMTIVAVAQLWAYAFGNASPWVAAASFVLFVVVFTWLGRSPFFVQFATMGSPALNVAVAAAVLIAVFFVMWSVVSVQRRGGWTANIRRKAQASVPVRRRPPFSSAGKAQFWFEWRQYGLLLPMFVGGMAVAYFLGLPLVVGVFRISNVTGRSADEPLFHIDWYSSAQFITTGLGLSALIGSIMVGGVMFMRGGHWNSQSNYLVTRPLSLVRISNARIYAMLASAALALAILVILVLGLEMVTRLRGESTGLLVFLHQGYEQLPRLFVFGMFAGGLLLMMWTFAWSASYLYIMGVFAVLVLPPLAVIWGSALFGLSDVSEATAQMETLVPYLNWTAAVLVMAGLLAMAWVADEKCRLHPAMPWAAAGVWIAYSYAFVHYTQKWDAGIQAREWAMRFPHPVNWPVWIAVSTLPLVPLFLHPLLLERIRHR